MVGRGAAVTLTEATRVRARESSEGEIVPSESESKRDTKERIPAGRDERG